MTILRVGPNSAYASIASAMLDANNDDDIWLEPGFANEDAPVTKTGMSVWGDTSSTGIVLRLTTGIPSFTLLGSAPITVVDATDGNAIAGNAGDNVIWVRDGADAVNGGGGIDRLMVDYRLATGAVTGNSTSNVAEAGGSRLVTITDGTFEHFTIRTGSGADTLTTAAGDDNIDTGGGASTVSVGQGRNYVQGGNGADTVTGLDGGNTVHASNGTNTVTTGGGDDLITTGTGSDTIVAGGGNDLVYVSAGADDVAAGAGTDKLIVKYGGMTTAVTGGVTGGNLAGGYTGQIADGAGSIVDLTGVEDFTVITGTGNDVITTGAGVDDLIGGAGNDTLNAGAGDDSLKGETGADQLFGMAGSDRLSGWNGTDNLNGDDGDDVLLGHAGGDSLFGGDGYDRLLGGLGRDQLTGGAGPDAFLFWETADSPASIPTRDVVTDFVSGEDLIDLYVIDANALTTGNQVFTFIGGSAFGAVAGQLRYAGGLLAGDVNGDGQADLAIEMTGQPTLNAGDFLF